MAEKKLNGTVIVTYRCNARCTMCNRYKAPSRAEEELSIETIKKLPKMYFTNITGGEPFIRRDLKDIVRELYKKSDRIVISTNGFFTDRIIDLCEEFPNVGIRISIEGLLQTNDKIRGLENGYNRGYATLKKLVELKHPDVGFGMTVQDLNAPDLVPLYKISDELGMEFATASLHNSFYFVEAKNIIHDRPMVAKNFEDLVNELISIEGLLQTNDKIRGLENGYNRGYATLKKLVELKHPDVGFGMTVQDLNAPDLVPLYKISDELGMEFATASLHNSFYFVEAKNIIHDRPMVAKNFEDLVNELLRSNSPKKWFRAYFNHGLINYIYGQPRLLPCDMAFDTFFIDPYGDVMPCNGTKDKEVMGNLNEESWDELWNSDQAEKVRAKVRHCDRNCWMIGSVSPAMHKYIWKPGWWVLKHKVKALFTKKPYDMHELKVVRDYEEGRVTKEQLDACSTCDLCAKINDGLSEASKADAHVYETHEAM